MIFVFTYSESIPSEGTVYFYVARVIQANNKEEAWKLFADNTTKNINYLKRNYTIHFTSDLQIIGFDL